ncbi:Nif11-like leader peptide family RiPP precursor [Azospirillum agricola]|uniref:Nif11-like leader peptide family RiPP precursor n=1 Tax=Azospirillum agricola TaxID=1720247 RepID=UPI000A0F3658|nr:Nif11-like leader peptide family RiPP precursor [Azospirillum agricola]SMH30356.1 nif11-like leader peptide domain-containing protein [Azospirillum lipoferum]
MSQAEIERFVTAANTTPALIETYRTATDAADMATRLRADGYDVTDAEIAAVIAGHGNAELSDEELDGVAGGSRVRSPRELFRQMMS